MSYPRDLDDYSDEELMQELNERQHRRHGRLCTYCAQRYDHPSCKYPERHKADSRQLPFIRFEAGGDK